MRQSPDVKDELHLRSTSIAGLDIDWPSTSDPAGQSCRRTAQSSVAAEMEPTLNVSRKRRRSDASVCPAAKRVKYGPTLATKRLHLVSNSLPLSRMPTFEEPVIDFENFFKDLHETISTSEHPVCEVDYSQFIDFNACHQVPEIDNAGMESIGAS